MTEPEAPVCATRSRWGGSCIDVGRPSMYLWCRGCLRADVDRLTAERDKLALRQLQYQDEVRRKKVGIETLTRLRAEAEAQRDAAVTALRELGECGCYGSTVVLRCEHVEAALAGPSTVTPEDWAKHQEERARNEGKSVEELKKQYGLCERVSVCCKSAGSGDGSDHTCGNCRSQLASFTCATHGCVWPDEGECPGNTEEGSGLIKKVSP